MHVDPVRLASAARGTRMPLCYTRSRALPTPEHDRSLLMMTSPPQGLLPSGSSCMADCSDGDPPPPS
jgi:hypothetical protein